MADNDLYGSNAPVFTVDGERQSGMARDVLRLEVAEDTLGMKCLTARFVAWGPQPGAQDEGELYLDGRVLDFGKSLDVSIGPASSARTIFKGAISAIEAEYREGAEPQVIVRAEDALMKLRWTHRCKTYEQVSDADLVRAIASEHGLTAEAEAEGPTHTVVQQWNQSDLAFLRERARLLQAELWLEGQTLHFKTREQRHATELTLVNGNQILSLRACADLAHQRSEIHVGGYDVGQRESLDESAAGDVVRGEAGAGRLGPDVLSQAFSDFSSHRLREVPLDRAAATAWARAEMLRRARRFVRVHGVTSGTPEMMVGSHLTLQRVAAPFAGGSYVVTRLMHSYDLTNGHRTRFVAERPALGGA
jgi:Bacteriophage probable baseplate hub protein